MVIIVKFISMNIYVLNKERLKTGKLNFWVKK